MLSTSYDFARRELSMLDPAPAALDDEIRAMTRAYATADAERPRAAMRDALSMDELYLLFSFGMRQCVFALRGMTSHGIGLVRRSSRPWKPAGDLAQLTATIAEIVNQDRYQIEDVEIATQLPPVWLKAPDKDLTPLLDRARATAVIHTRLRPAEEDGLGLLIWIVEFNDRQTAEALRAIGPSQDESIVIQEGTLFCIIVHKSVMHGAALVETAATLERFRDRVQTELRLLAR